MRSHNALVQNQTTSDSWQHLLEMPRKSWWARLPFGIRMAAGGSALLVLIGGGTAGVAALTEDEPRIVTAVDQASPAGAAALPQVPAAIVPRPPAAGAGFGTLPRPDLAAAERTSDEADRTGTRAPRSASTGTKPAPARAARRHHPDHHRDAHRPVPDTADP